MKTEQFASAGSAQAAGKIRSEAVAGRTGCVKMEKAENVEFRAAAFRLLTTWCDRLLELQITEKTEKEFYGGILCPACGRIHGRCGDAIYPMVYLADTTGDKKYLDGAKRLFAWSSNLYRREGCYDNDTNSNWRGITVFAVIQLGETLLYHERILDEETKDAWKGRFLKSAEYLLNHIDEIGGNINYPVTCAYAMALAARISGRREFSRKAGTLAAFATEHLTEEGLLYGEGKKREAVSPKGCRPVDLGYNVEESLPALLQYAVLEGDQAVYEAAVKAMKAHLAFMLPDGAWDNSWGTRNNKWSYWGSRTSDGCQTGYGLLAASIPEFSEAVRRNTALLARCTRDGLLYGGPMFVSAGEPACVHHTFCHAKALASFLEHGEELQAPGMLPADEREGIFYYPSVHVALAGAGDWRATVSDYDVEYSESGHATGGAITLLWHKRLGPVITGTMGHYALVEPNNMQLPRNSIPVCLTPRIAARGQEGIWYESSNDLTARVEYQEDEKELPCRISIQAEGVLRDGKQNGSSRFMLSYHLTDEGVTVTALSPDRDGVFFLPLVSSANEEMTLSEDGRSIFLTRNEGAVLCAETNSRILLGNEPESHYCGRLFNPVGGMQAVDCRIFMEKNIPITIRIREGHR